MRHKKNSSTERQQLRNTLLHNGYRPLPLVDKGIRIKGWSRADITEEWLDRYNRSARFANTGIRCDDLVAFDIDITEENLADEIERIVEDVCGPTELCRIGKWPKRLLLYKLTGESIRSARTGKYGQHQVELLATSGRQFAAYGKHPDTAQNYEWCDDTSPVNTHFDDLPAVTAEVAQRCLEKCQIRLEDTGYELSSSGSMLDSMSAQEHDLQPLTPIEIDGLVTTWQDIRNTLDEKGIWGNFLRENGEFGDSNAVHFYIAQGTGQPCAHDFPRDVTHWESIMPSDYAEAVPESTDQSDMFAIEGNPLGELIDNYVLVNDKTVRPIDHPEEIYTFEGFRLNHSHWQIPAPIKTNPARTINAVEAWAKDPQCLRASKAGLRPDHPNSVIVNEGRIKIFNTYNPPIHPDNGGEVDTLLEFVDHLIPAPADRDIFLDWHAHKMANPGDRMHGLAMVTPSYGVGRGTWVQILQRLFGMYYVNEIPLGQLVGRGGQSEFNEYLANSLIVSVPEALEEKPEETKWQARHMAYEQLKLIVDPISQRVQIRRKYGRNTVEWCYASILISSNHTDALAMEPNDRRMIILDNNRLPLVDATADLHNRIQDWKLRPANIGALERYLLNRAAQSSYNPHAKPPMTPAKKRMVDLSRSDTDILFTRFSDEAKGAICTYAQWRKYAYEKRLSADLDLPHDSQKLDAALTAVLAQKGNRLASLGDKQMKIDGQVVRLWIIRDVEKWENCKNREVIRAEVCKNGDVGGKVIDLRGV